MAKYELTVVVAGNVEEETLVATLEKSKSFITDFGGQITDVKDYGKKRLAYEIQKQTEGYYYFIQFDAETTVPAEIEARLRIQENVIRFMCVRLDEE
ncbi:MAG: 30S ribosomal protein S6 [Lachnospiraceae bacterium]|nr:30S ribosomal protein S6 [Lachnospiraceae bacterium]